MLDAARILPDSLVEGSEYLRFDHVHGLFLPNWQTGIKVFLPLAAWPRSPLRLFPVLALAGVLTSFSQWQPLGLKSKDI